MAHPTDSDRAHDRPSSADADVTTHLTRMIDYIRWGASRFSASRLAFGHGSDNALDEAAHLVMHSLGLDADLPDIYLQATLTPRERCTAVALIEKRIETRLPAPYLTGRARFAGMEFFVDKRVIIPRSPIAELIGQAFEPWLSYREPLSILDLCTGSGAIALACAETFPEASVVATDASEAALEVADINCRKHNAGPQVELVSSDLYDNLPGRRFDLIVTNPPYVSHEEWSGLKPEYHHEPGFAFHGDRDNLALVERILLETPPYLHEDGLLVIEVGASAYDLEQQHPDLPVNWVELMHGGMGVGVIEAEDLAAWAESVMMERK